MDQSTIDRINVLLLNRECTEVDSHGGSPLVLLQMNGLFIASPWRLRRGGQILCGSGDGEEAVPLLSKEIRRRRAVAARIEGPFHDLSLKFDCGVTLETFANALKFESWQVAAGPAQMIIAGPGGSWSDFHAP